MAACVSALVLPIAANAAGLGRLTVLSALGQPLNAEVELVSAQKGETLSARLSSIDTYAQANLTFNAALVGARVTVERRPNGQPYLRITTPRPVNEPFADLLIEVNSENGKVTRQYTVLLDPPGYGRAAGEIPPPTVAAAPAARSAPVETRAIPPQDASASAAAAPGASTEAGAPGRAAASREAPAARSRSRVRESAPTEAAGGRQYGPIKRGETLGGIARTVQPEGATLEQTLVSLYRQNPDAFIKKNMNLVKSGRILKVPEASEMTALPHREAVQEVRLQVADFNSFRGRIADRAADAPEAGSTTSGRIGARVADRPAGESRDTVKLSRGEGGGKGGKAGSDRLRALEEEAVAREKALADANERIAALEKTIKDLQRRADLQTAPGKGTTPAPAAKGEAPGAVAVAPVIPPPAKAPPAADSGKAAPSPQVDANKATPSPSAPQADAGKAPAAAPPPQADGPKAAPSDADKAPDTQTAGNDMKAAPPKAKAPPPAVAPPPERDLMDTVMDEPLYLAGAVGGVVLLGGLALVATRRRRGADAGRVKIAPTLTSGSGSDAGSRSAAPAPSGKSASPEIASPRAPSASPARSSATVLGGAAATGAAAASAPAAATAAGRPGTAPSTGDDNDLDFNAASRPAAPAPAERPRQAAALRAEPAPRAKTEAPAAKAEPPLKTAAPAAQLESLLRPASSPPKVESPVRPAPAAKPEPLQAAASGGAKAEPPLKAGAPASNAQSILNKALGRRTTPTPPPDAPPAPPERPAARESASAPSVQAPLPMPSLPPSVPDMALPDFALDVPPVTPPAGAGAGAGEKKDPAPLDFNMDFNLEPLPPINTPADIKDGLDSKPAADSTDLDFKLGDLNLSFGETPAQSTPAKDDHWYDVQQKFDLAKAYEEMGDKAGARDILQEVVKEGDTEQQAQAKKLLGSLG